MTTSAATRPLSTAVEFLIVFAREPVAGQVKTRLAADSSDAFALAVYKRLLRRSVRLARSVVKSRRDQGTDCRLVIAGAWSDRSSPISLGELAKQSEAMLITQPSGDLGERMQAGFDACFAAGARRVVLMGCDCPGLRTGDLEQGLNALQSHEVVLGPTLDGGYCLVGLSGPARELFERMRWSQPDVMEQTVARVGQRSLSTLSPQRDIDHLADWEVWCRHRASIGLHEDLVWRGVQSLAGM